MRQLQTEVASNARIVNQRCRDRETVLYYHPDLLRQCRLVLSMERIHANGTDPRESPTCWPYVYHDPHGHPQAMANIEGQPSALVHRNR